MNSYPQCRRTLLTLVLAAIGTALATAGRAADVQSGETPDLSVNGALPLFIPRSAYLADAFNTPDEQIYMPREAFPHPQPDPRGRHVVGVTASAPPTTGAWRPTHDGGWVWTTSVTAEGAAAVRVLLAVVHQAPSTEIAVYDPAQVVVYTPGDAARAGQDEFWTPEIPCGTLQIEYWIANEDIPDRYQPPLTIMTVAYILADVAEPATRGCPAAPVATCHTSVATTNLASRAVARIRFISAAQCFDCSGALIRNAQLDADPLLLTANHCISTATEAASVQVHWLWQMQDTGALSCADCGGLCVCAGANVCTCACAVLPSQTGAAFLAGDAEADITLLRLNNPLPNPETFTDLNGDGTWVPGEPLNDLNGNGVRDDIPLTFLGWNPTDRPSEGSFATSIHHPAGCSKRISSGSITDNAEGCGFLWWGGDTREGFRIDWSTGTAEQGSSGGPALNANDMVIGVVSCGACEPGSASSCYCVDERHATFGAFWKFLERVPGAESILAPGFTWYVDGAYADSSNGTPAHPWSSAAQAAGIFLALPPAARPNTFVIQPGNYPGPLILGGSPLKLVNTGLTHSVILGE